MAMSFVKSLRLDARGFGVARGLAVVALAGGVLVVGAGVGGCKKKAEVAGKAAPVERVVRMVPVTVRPVDRYIEVTGTVFGEEDVTVAAEVGGRVVSIAADLGDVVGPGGALAQIDPVDSRLAVEEERAAFVGALAKIGLERLPEGELDVSKLPTVARAEAQEANARAKLERARKLYEQKPPLISEQDFADIETQLEVAATGASVERLNARALVADARTRESALRRAEQTLADTAVVAPVSVAAKSGTDGAGRELRYRVAARRVSVGETVGVGQAMFRLVASDRVKFRGQVPERFAASVRVGAKVFLAVDAFATPFEAVVARVSPAVDAATRAFEVEVEAANGEGKLKPGSFAVAKILGETQAGARFVPEGAVTEFAGVQRVFSVKEGKAVEHRVRVGKTAGGMVEVLEGLDGVETVIERAAGLAAGSVVRVE